MRDYINIFYLRDLLFVDLGSIHTLKRSVELDCGAQLTVLFHIKMSSGLFSVCIEWIVRFLLF